MAKLSDEQMQTLFEALQTIVDAFSARVVEKISARIPLQIESLKDEIVPSLASAFKREEWSPADKHWGYAFGSYGLMTTKQVCAHLGCVTRSVARLAEAGKLRSGKLRSAQHSQGSRRLYCSRSVALYLKSIEE